LIVFPPQIKIQSSGGLSDSDIERMVREAEANAGADAERKAVVEARNEADSVCYSTEKTLAEHKAKVPQADVDAINADIAAVKEVGRAIPEGGARGRCREHLYGKAMHARTLALGLSSRQPGNTKSFAASGG
jgi:molecular chaperone DnaK